MPEDVDTRDLKFQRVTKNFDAAKEVSTNLPSNHTVNVEWVNPFTGSTRVPTSVNATRAFAVMPGQGPSNATLIDSALKHVESVATALGFDKASKPEFVPDPYVIKTSVGTRVVNLQQQFHGIPVFKMERAVEFEKSGEVKLVTGDSVIYFPPDLESLPAVPLPIAVKTAAEFMNSPSDETDPWTGEKEPQISIDVSGYQPEILGRIAIPAQPAVLNKGPFGENIPAYLVFFYQGPTTRLGWHLIISTPNMEEQYELIIGADAEAAAQIKPPVLYCRKTTQCMAHVRGAVWVQNPGINHQRQVVDFPMPKAYYPIDGDSLNLPDELFPRPWLDDDNDLTVGNNTIATLGDSPISVRGVATEGFLTFDPGPGQEQGDDQKVINIFYFCNYMHDFFYMLGFDEAHGNFQRINFTGMGKCGDPVHARAHRGHVPKTANMTMAADGLRGLMNMGLVKKTNRHTAFDSDVVFHEYAHGVTNRLLGGLLDAIGLQEMQSRGMSEGWSDYFALTIQNCLATMQNPAAVERVVIGHWLSNRPEGMRLAPYDDNYPGTFGSIGNPPYHKEHAIGEIWCATLMKMNRDFGLALGDRVRGHRLGWQVVVDGLKLTPKNPSFRGGRSAILRALEDLKNDGRLSPVDYKKAYRAAWLAFARFGMGPKMSSIGSTLEGIEEDRTPPAGI